MEVAYSLVLTSNRIQPTLSTPRVRRIDPALGTVTSVARVRLHVGL